MHDLVLDLARWASRKICFHLDDKSNIDMVRHLSYTMDYLEGNDKFEALNTNEKHRERVRSFLPLGRKHVTSFLLLGKKQPVRSTLAVRRRTHWGTDMAQIYIAPTVIFYLLPKLKRLRWPTQVFG